MSKVKRDCTVSLKDGRTFETDVMIMNSGWIRTGTGGQWSYYPPGEVQVVNYEVQE